MSFFQCPHRSRFLKENKFKLSKQNYSHRAEIERLQGADDSGLIAGREDLFWS